MASNSASRASKVNHGVADTTIGMNGQVWISEGKARAAVQIRAVMASSNVSVPKKW